MVCCPFHEDDTPSAKLYKDDDGVERLFCFGCQRQWTSYDYVTLVLEEDPEAILNDMCSPQELDILTKVALAKAPRKPKDISELVNFYKETHDLYGMLRKAYKSITCKLDQ